MLPSTLVTMRPRLGLSSAFSDFFEPWNDFFHDGSARRSMTYPRVNISENKTSYNLEFAVPGLHKKDIKIDVNGDMLTVSAQKEETKEEKEEKYTCQEYNYSSFSRSFTLPEDVQQDKIEATYDGGILKLALLKNEKTVLKNHKTVAIK